MGPMKWLIKIYQPDTTHRTGDPLKEEANRDFIQVAYGAHREREIVNYQIPRTNYALSALANRNEGKVSEISHTENVRMAHFAYSCYSIGPTYY